MKLAKRECKANFPELLIRNTLLTSPGNVPTKNHGRIFLFSSRHGISRLSFLLFPIANSIARKGTTTRRRKQSLNVWHGRSHGTSVLVSCYGFFAYIFSSLVSHSPSSSESFLLFWIMLFLFSSCVDKDQVRVTRNTSPNIVIRSTLSFGHDVHFP